MHPMKLLFAMFALVAAFLASPARAEAIPCNIITCSSGNCSKVCTNSHTGQQTTCGEYYHWECTPECARGAPTHYTPAGFFQRYAGPNSGPLECDDFSEFKEHYTDSCGNSFYKCVFFYTGPGECEQGVPTEPQCTGGI